MGTRVMKKLSFNYHPLSKEECLVHQSLLKKSQNLQILET